MVDECEGREGAWLDAKRTPHQIGRGKAGHRDYAESNLSKTFTSCATAVFRESREAERDVVRTLLADEARDRVDRAAALAGITDVRDPAYETLPEFTEAQRLVDIATGKLEPIPVDFTHSRHV